MTRGALKAAIERALSRDALVIADSMNYIKGFRYELFCIAKSQTTPLCVVRHVVPSTHVPRSPIDACLLAESMDPWIDIALSQVWCNTPLETARAWNAARLPHDRVRLPPPILAPASQTTVKVNEYDAPTIEEMSDDEDDDNDANATTSTTTTTTDDDDAATVPHEHDAEQQTPADTSDAAVPLDTFSDTWYALSDALRVTGCR